MRFEPGQDKVNIWTMENKAYTAPAYPPPAPKDEGKPTKAKGKTKAKKGRKINTEHKNKLTTTITAGGPAHLNSVCGQLVVQVQRRSSHRLHST